MQEGDYSEIASRIDQIEPEAWQKPKEESAGSSAERGTSDTLPSSVTNNDPAANRGASGDIAVYKWYFKAVGGMNFVIFMILCMLFVLGVIYPRKMTRTSGFPFG